MSYSPELLAKVGHYYYFEQLTMAEIGMRLGFSRHKVGRLIKESVDTGIVKIEIQAVLVKGVHLAQQLEQKLNLKTSVVVDVSKEPDTDAIKNAVCIAGANFVAERISDGDTVGIGWGSTTHGLVEKFSPQETKNVTVVQVTGGNKHLSSIFDCQDVTRSLAQKLGVDPVLLHAPAIVDSKDVRDVFVKQSAIASTFAHFDDLNLTIVGIGSLVPSRSSTLLTSGYLTEPTIDSMTKTGAVGDVFSYFIDADGGIIDTELHERIISIKIEQLRNVNSSIGIASGKTKAKAVLAAVLGGFVNILIVDSMLAEEILHEAELRG
ncbi:MAG: sugar-binding transcriptional regulator [Paracoccaceae bacterium]